ncbi:RNA polymerase sigma factor [Edaphobacter aggregans]|uniref:RNA polymerase sigma factor n=1 Tax=Edaphobacter aggregans TaxID=570835 RepID=UPI001FDEC099|nr:RNA polymerase sigma factor [Edaphobacter aggregans]
MRACEMDVTAEWTEHVRTGRTALTDGRIAERDAEFAALVERNARRMFRVAYSLLRNAHDAEDAVQEAFLKLYRGDGWRRMENEGAFLARTVWRVALDRLAPRRETEDAAEIAFGGESPEELAAGGDERELLRLMIDGLPEDLRQPLVLSAIEEMTSGEVAAVMGIPEGTVRTRVMRARAELKKRFAAAREVRR